MISIARVMGLDNLANFPDTLQMCISNYDAEKKIHFDKIASY